MKKKYHIMVLHGGNLQPAHAFGIDSNVLFEKKDEAENFVWFLLQGPPKHQALQFAIIPIYTQKN